MIEVKRIENGTMVVSSRQISEDFGKEHKNVVRSIENLTAQNSAVKDIIIESTFNHKGNDYKEYLLTRDGFSLLVMGFTGAKALEWKLKYIEAFNSMEKTLINHNPYLGMSKEIQAIFALDQKQQQIENKVQAVQEDIQGIKDDMPLFNIECEELQKLLRKKGIEKLGGKSSRAYKDNSLRTKVYTDIQREIKRQFQIQSYKAIKRKNIKVATEIINEYRLPIFLEDEINTTNNQVNFEEVI